MENNISSRPSPIRQVFFPVLAAIIWGTAFVSQSIVSEYIGPFTFNTLRSIVASVVLCVVLLIFHAVDRAKARSLSSDMAASRPKTNKKMLIIGGLCCGTALTLASNLQQFGISADTDAGKAGFITALYIVLVPIMGLCLGKKVTPWIVASVGLAAIGLYFLCVDGSFTLAKGDIFLIICAFCFSIHILLIDYFTAYVDGVALSCGQFMVMTVLSGIFMLIFEHKLTWDMLSPCIGQVLYVGVFSSGVAYTLQILAQKGSNPTVVSLLLSLESVFATVAGAIILHETMNGREYIGCAIMLLAVILAQLPSPTKKNKKSLGQL